MKTKQKLIPILVALVLALCLISMVACGAAQGKVKGEIPVHTQDLLLFKTGLQLTQEQQAERIKAEYLVANNGYKDEDKLTAIVTLDSKSLIDYYLADDDTDATNVAEYARTEKGAALLSDIRAEQTRIINDLAEKGLIESVANEYQTITNAVAVRTTYGAFRLMDGMAGISTMLSETYNRPQAITDASTIINAVDIYDTGIFNPGDLGYTGKKTAVAVLDSGFDCDHTVFRNMPAPEDMLIDRNFVAEKLPLTNAVKLDQTATLSRVYVNAKIPFTFDYADKDTNVYPYDSEHGTHVAGIIGGKDDRVTGAAIDTQLVLMKVFPDLDAGGRTEDILAALEDAVLLGVDAINMSLGSSCGFSRERDDEARNKVYNSINEAGISLITAASNSYNSAFSGEQGNNNKVTNPDTATVGSPSTYPGALSVASISGTKSRYLVANDSEIIFYTESNSIDGKPNNFFADLYEAMGKEQSESVTLDYVVIPGVGSKANYTGINVTGKIALVRRGDTTFEDKAIQAKLKGAKGIIIYNNIEGEILMSMGKTKDAETGKYFPTVSITKELGERLAAHGNGTITFAGAQQAGPFMSDFSSWGPTPDLKLKPEITAHGGNILSAIPGGGYDELSGTSMATPNLCGIVVLIRQYLKEKFPAKTAKEISVLCNQMLMSTATIAVDPQGNPYSPRKQGAGLASLGNLVGTDVYLTVDGIDRTKLELGDDAERTGVYTMQYNAVNLGTTSHSYAVSLVGMTETVSTSDSSFIAEKDQILGGHYVVEVAGSVVSDGIVTVGAGETVSIKVTYTLTDADKSMMDSLFPFGIYVEGYVKMLPTVTGEREVALNIPFLAFYGDWTQAPMFDKTHFEVEAQAHDGAIDDEDKLKADYYATTPYGSYLYSYMIPLGSYLYKVDTNEYKAIPASEEHIAISNIFGTIDGISAVYAGVLRNASSMRYTIVDKVTGEQIKDFTALNARKAYSNGAQPLPNYEYLRWTSRSLNLVNNRKYTFTMKGLLDYGDGGESTNERNSFTFDFTYDNEAPIIRSASYEKKYDRALKKDRYYMTMVLFDNHYVQSITPIAFTSSSSYTVLDADPIPVYGKEGQDVAVRFEITKYLDELGSSALISSALGFAIDDYALNSDIYLCQLPGTRGDFKFTEDGTEDGNELVIKTIDVGEAVDLVDYLYTSDATVDADKDYLQYLDWSSSDEEIAQLKKGVIVGKKAGVVTVVVQETVDMKKAVLIVRIEDNTPTVTATKEDTLLLAGGESVDSAKIKGLRFDYFDTVFAYSRAAQTSDIGQTGDRKYLSAIGNTISFYPGEKIKLSYQVDPWYVADRYDFTFSSMDNTIATVEEDGTVTALAKGRTTITLRDPKTTLVAQVDIEVKSEFVIDGRMLVAYKGLGGKVVIPDDEGILYIGSFAFCLYDTDYTIEVSDDDFDANKIPSTNTSVTEVVIPDGITEIQKYAFYNCSGLRKVTLPDSVKYIREYAFYRDVKLESINMGKTETVGAHAFDGCTALVDIDLSQVLSVGVRAFDGCTAIPSADLSKLRNVGKEAFRGTTSLESVVLHENTILSTGMFVQSGLTEVHLYTGLEIPEFCFAQCDKLTTVVIYNDLVNIFKGAFCQNPALTTVEIRGAVSEKIHDQAFYDCNALESITLPNSTFALGTYVFYDCDTLTTIQFGANTCLSKVDGTLFNKTALSTFVVDAANPHYTASVDGSLLLNKAGDTILLAGIADISGDYTLPAGYTAVGASAFAGAPITTLTISSPVAIGDYAFANCVDLTQVTLPATAGTTIGAHAFAHNEALTAIDNLDKVLEVGDYAISQTGIEEVVIAANAAYGEGVFFRSSLKKATLGANGTFGLGCFQYCTSLSTVIMPAEGGVHFGSVCFAYDTKLYTIDLSKTDSLIEKQCFYGCSALRKAELENVVTIEEYAFADCTALTTVTMPIVERIDEGAFGRFTEKAGAPALTSVELPSTLTTMGDGVFTYCANLESVTIPSGITALPRYTFAFCAGLKSVTLPHTLIEICDYAFAGCTELSTVNLGNVQTIGDYAFTSSNALATIDISSARTIGAGAFADTIVTGNLTATALTKVGDYAFQNGKLLGLDAPALVEIGTGAFQGNKSLAHFRLSLMLEKVGYMAFESTESLPTFTVMDSTGIDKTTRDFGKDGYAKLVNGVLYTITPLGDYVLSAVPGGMDVETLEVIENTVRIDTYAGSSNKHIKRIILPSTLAQIGSYAFYGYEALEEVEFRSFVAPTWENAYSDTLTLDPEDPGYDILHNQFHVTYNELCYTNFIDMLGKHKPITMKLPANLNLVGYDAVTYLVTFGKVEDALRSDKEAMDTILTEFVALAQEVSSIETVTLANEKVINAALTALNAVKQNPTDFGYDEAQWSAWVEAVRTKKQALNTLKLEAASQKVKDLQASIAALPAEYTPDAKEAMQAIEVALNELSSSDRALLSLDKYNSLYDAYLADVAGPVEPTPPDIDPAGPSTPEEPATQPVWLWVTIVASVLVVLIIAAVVVVIILRKRGNQHEENQ